MAELKLVVFDVDGTLIDSLAHIKGAMKTAFDTCGHIPPSEAAVRAIIGLSLPEAMRQLDPKLSDAELMDVVEAYKNSFNRSETRPCLQARVRRWTGCMPGTLCCLAWPPASRGAGWCG